MRSTSHSSIRRERVVAEAPWRTWRPMRSLTQPREAPSGPDSREVAAAMARTPGSLRPVHVVAGICVLGVLLTAVASWAAADVDRNTEGRLLRVQTRQAASILSVAILVIQQPLSAALDVQKVV